MKKCSRPITVEGVTYKSIREACDYYKLNYKKVNERINRYNWSIEEAFELVEKNVNNKPIPITVGDKIFESMGEACKHYNLNDAKVRARLKLGWSIDEAFELVGRPKQSKGKVNPIIVAGKTFKSMTEACEYYNLNVSCVTTRINKLGWTVEEAFGLIKKDINDNKKPITLEGVTYESIKEASKYYNLKYNKIVDRLYRGWTPEEAFGLVERNKTKKPITVGGVTYKSIKEACEYHKLNIYKVSSRLKLGWTNEEAFELVKKDNDNNRQITVEGITYKSIAEACKQYNLSYNIVTNRLNKLGWSIEEAFELVDKDSSSKPKPITIEGVTFKSISEACRYYNIDRVKVSSRLKLGWTNEEAFELVERDEQNKKPITVEGVTYESIKEASKYYNLDPILVSSRLRSKWSIEEAFELSDKIVTRDGVTVTLKGKTFKSISEACRYYNIDIDPILVYNRLKIGWIPEEAFGLVERKNERYINIVLEGKTFKSISEACKYYNIDYNKVQSRIKRNWTYEEAFELVERDDSHRKPITVGDKTFKSMTEACNYYNISYEIVYNRLKLGWSLEEAFELVYTDKLNYVIVEGKTFKTLVEACEYYNADESLVNSRLSKNWNLIDALTTPVLVEMEGKHIKVEDNHFISIAEACRYYGVNRSRVYYKLNHGWSIEEAFGFEFKYNDNKKPITVEGVTYKSIAEACKQYNLKPHRIIQRLHSGWTIEEAFELVERDYKNKKPITLEGVTYKSITEACKHYNLNHNIVSSRLYKGWAAEEAFEIVKKDNKIYNASSITVDGVTYRSIAEACRHYNIRKNTVYFRFKKGWTIEEAFELVPRKRNK